MNDDSRPPRIPRERHFNLYGAAFLVICVASSVAVLIAQMKLAAWMFY